MAKKNEKTHKRLSIAELRNFSDFKDISDKEATETIKVLEKLSFLFYELYTKQKQEAIEGNLNKIEKTIDINKEINEKSKQRKIA